MKILLTGNEGYVGSGLTRYLEQSHEVIGWNRSKDICTLNFSVLEKLEIDAIVNCAVVTDRANQVFKLDSLSNLINVGGALALTRSLKGSNIPLIHISTKDVFGKTFSRDDIFEEKFAYRPKFRIDDDHPFRPESIYAKSKLMAEFILEDHPETVIIRLSSCYSDFDHPKGSWIVTIAKMIQSGKPIIVSHNGKQFRDLLHVNDLGKLIETILSSHRFGIKLNAGGGHENTHSVLEVIKMYDPSANICETADDRDYGFAFSNNRVKEVFKWQPKINFIDRVSTILANIKIGRRAIE